MMIPIKPHKTVFVFTDMQINRDVSLGCGKSKRKQKGSIYGSMVCQNIFEVNIYCLYCKHVSGYDR